MEMPAPRMTFLSFKVPAFPNVRDYEELLGNSVHSRYIFASKIECREQKMGKSIHYKILLPSTSVVAIACAFPRVYCGSFLHFYEPHDLQVKFPFHAPPRKKIGLK